MPTATRPGLPGSGQSAIERLREAKRNADARLPTTTIRPRSALERLSRPADRAPVEPPTTVIPELTVPVPAPTGAVAKPTVPRVPTPGVPGSGLELVAHVSAGGRRENIVRTLASLSRLRVGIAAAMILVLLAGVSVAASSAVGRGALAAGTAPASPVSASKGIPSLVNPAGALNPPVAAKLVDGSAIQPIDSTPYEISLGGASRYFRIHFPSDVPPRVARPLILVLPGWRRTARDAEREYGFDQLSDTAKVTVAYVDGVHNSWNAGTCCGYASTQRLDDLGALHVVVDAISKLVKVDRRHVIMAGFSNGAMLALRGACSESSQLAGVIVASGSLQVSSCKPGPLSMVISHGGRDTTLPIVGLKHSAYLDGPVTSLAATLAPFAKADACASSVTHATGRFVISALSRCATGSTITTYIDELGGHAWLGQVPAQGVVGGQSFAYTAWRALSGRTSVVPFSP